MAERNTRWAGAVCKASTQPMVRVLERSRDSLVEGDVHEPSIPYEGARGCAEVSADPPHI